jgi:hypothetical protein
MPMPAPRPASRKAQIEITAAESRHDRARREWLMIGLALSVLITVMAIILTGDTVDFTPVYGSSKAMGVNVPHSMHYRFVARHPASSCDHCATQPMRMHTGAGMVGCSW